MYTNKVPSDSYFFIDTKWKSDFSHIVPCRGYNLKSQLRFNESIFWIESSNWYEVTKEQYEEHVYGRTEQAEAQQENPPKRASRKAKVEDSPKPRKPRKTTAQAGKGKPSVVRKPAVRNVRKPKESVQGTDNPGTKTPTRSRKPKGSTQ